MHLVPYIEGLHYLVYTFYTVARICGSLRDEDISFPPVVQQYHKMTVKEITISLEESMQKLNKSAVWEEQDLALHLKFMKSLVQIVAITLDKGSLAGGSNPSEEESKGGKGKKKKKSAAAKSQALDLQPHIQSFQ